MREIKFRAFDIENNKMFKADEMSFRTNGDVFKVWAMNRDDDESGLLINPSTGFLMQFIGYKDINKKEFYEDDIITKNNRDFLIIKYENGGFHANLIGGGASFHISICVKEYRIVGNKFENPELLKQGE